MTKINIKHVENLSNPRCRICGQEIVWPKYVEVHFSLTKVISIHPNCGLQLSCGLEAFYEQVMKGNEKAKR